MITLLIAGIFLVLLGACRVVSRLPRRPIQWGMGMLLLAGAVIMALTGLKLLPGGGVATGLSGAALVFAVAANFGLGMLEALGIGSYAPSLIVLSLFGMDPRAAFPIMMGSAAYILPAAAIKFAQAGRYDHRASLGLTLGGIPAVLIAAYVVKTLPLDLLRWLVVFVVSIAAVGLLGAARGGCEAAAAPAAASA